MKNAYTYPTPSNTHADPLLRDYDLPYFIDMAPLEAAMRGLCVLLGLVIAQGGQPRLMDKVSRQILAACEGSDICGLSQYSGGPEAFYARLSVMAGAGLAGFGRDSCA